MKWLFAIMSMFLFFLVTPIDIAATIDVNENPVCIAVDNDVGTFGYLCNNTAIEQESPLFSLNPNYSYYEVNQAEISTADRHSFFSQGVTSVLKLFSISDFGMTITESNPCDNNRYISPNVESEYYNLNYIRVL